MPRIIFENRDVTDSNKYKITKIVNNVSDISFVELDFNGTINNEGTPLDASRLNTLVQSDANDGRCLFISKMTQAAYDTLQTKDDNTLYIIIED